MEACQGQSAGLTLLPNQLCLITLIRTNEASGWIIGKRIQLHRVCLTPPLSGRQEAWHGRENKGACPLEVLVRSPVVILCRRIMCPDLEMTNGAQKAAVEFVLVEMLP